HAVLADRTSDARRTETFASYSFIGGMMGAAGSLLAALPDTLVSLSLARIDALRLMFIAYAVLGLMCAWLYALLPTKQTSAELAKPSALGPSKAKVYKLAAL